jgi:hypothetical protein
MAFNKKSVIKHPLARSERLLIENIDDETVIYDEESKTAHALKPLAAAVFLYADGSNSLSEIAELASYRLGTTVTETQVSDAVTELDDCALLDAPELADGVSRRDALKRFGAVGVAAGAGTMLISSIAAPMASAAGLSGYGAPYLCGTGSGNLTGNRGYPSVAYPQPSASKNWGSYIGDVCSSGSGTTYEGCLVDGVINSDISKSTCSSGFCLDADNNYISSVTSRSSCQQSYCEVTSSSGSSEYYWGVPSSDCKGSGGFCVNSSSGAYSSKSQSSCRSGYTWISGSSNHYASGSGGWQTGTVENSGSSGTYQCVPCDGDVNGAHYQCCEVVCVPNGVSIPGAILTKNSANLPAPYTNIPYADINYPSKYCTTGTDGCNGKGDCS